ncbi:MAG: PEBP family protein [Candidatus Magasanikbacteria bacterium GW2011_GWA2_56_11]|uniref:PEBP family protein n=1 Tax=Candidatus Magasanikbacteria bacterium GW2011_GWA2_56_11 TaxID=1619044 RepID=A0A0G2B9S4_9BACT|nr:MAG: PEBP family protein [Candidatus Magasanikbacteria bacterium GW2011_GWA2_56_11]
MYILSSAFSNGGEIPAEYTCDGADTPPPLSWGGIPETAQSLVLIADDPDAPSGTWVHWTVWNLDPKAAGLEGKKIPPGAVEGTTSFGRPGYGGPCPPSGVHRYFFKLLALDTQLGLPAGAGYAELDRAVQGHIIANAALVGIYSRKQ